MRWAPRSKGAAIQTYGADCLKDAAIQTYGADWFDAAEYTIQSYGEPQCSAAIQPCGADLVTMGDLRHSKTWCTQCKLSWMHSKTWCKHSWRGDPNCTESTGSASSTSLRTLAGTVLSSGSNTVSNTVLRTLALYAVKLKLELRTLVDSVLRLL